MKNKSYIPLLLLTVFILGMPKSFALTPEEKEAAKAEKEASKNARIAENCSSIATKISNRKTVVEKSITNLNASISKIEDIVNKRVAALNEKGVDTTTISSNLNEFKSRAQTIISAKQGVITTLNELDASSCQSDKKAFGEKVRSFNSSLKVQNAQQKELKNYVRENIINVIKSLGNSNE